MNMIALANTLLAGPARARANQTRVEYIHLGTLYTATFPGLLTRDQLEQRLIMQHRRYVKRCDFVSVTHV